MDRLEQGLLLATVNALRAQDMITDEETYTLIAPRRTLMRRQTLTAEEGDKVVRVARIAVRAQQVFSGRPQYAAEWLRSPKSRLGERTPMQALSTEVGALVVEELLIAVQHGLFG